MAVRNDEKHEQKQGLLAYGYKPGDRLPFFPEEVPHRVSKEGGVEWAPIVDYHEYWLNETADLRSYLQKKEDRVLHWILRGWNLLARALDGLPSRLDWVGVNIDDLKAMYPLETSAYWEGAPQQVQKLALISAHEYLKPQLT